MEIYVTIVLGIYAACGWINTIASLFDYGEEGGKRFLNLLVAITVTLAFIFDLIS